MMFIKSMTVEILNVRKIFEIIKLATRSLIPPWHPAVVDQDQHSRVPEISWIRFTLDLFDYLVPEVSLIRFV